ncbi:MAG: tRNA (adenosine(37)-N6)-threonylcarbamoyltransferase complex ATPase subunit type 1 TsaE [Clostridia bacterium]|nr:tRNA (adenosine(37)-N6)-threonylcarbamoyltransferase complex ATPase subunit type 1 TsaE [Clostridia bacterium]
MEKISFISGSEKQTMEFAASISQSFTGGEVLLLEGGIGAGKTRFTKGLAKGLKIKDAVTSPTFTIMHIYSGRLNLYHLDMYRIQSESELTETGIYEALDDKNGVTVIEWPQIAMALFDTPIKVSIKILDENKREITVIK